MEGGKPRVRSPKATMGHEQSSQHNDIGKKQKKAKRVESLVSRVESLVSRV